MITALKRSFKRPAHLWVFVVGIAAMVIHALYCFACSTSKSVVLFALIGIAIVALLYFLYVRLRNRDRKERVYLTALIALGLCFLFIFPPGTVPDEEHHYEASYAYSNGTPQLVDKQIDMRASDQAFVSSFETRLSLEYYQKTTSQLQLFSDDSSLVTGTAIANFGISGNPPQVKFASALGICLGRALDLSPLLTFYLGRIFNLALFIVLAYWAVRLTPVGKNIFMVVSLLPMTLHVAASYSYDASILGYAFFFTALCLKAIFEKKTQPPLVFIGIIFFGAILAPCKAVYSPLLLLALLIPKSAFARQKNAKWFKIGLFVAGFAMIGLITLSSISAVAVSSGGGDGLDHRGDESGHFYTVSELLANPANVAFILLNTFNWLGGFHLNTMLGTSLGWFQGEIEAPGYFVVVLAIVVLFSLLNHPGDKMRPGPLTRAVFIAVFAISTLGIVASMLLGHTFNTEELALGVQGRYFLPALPIGLLALRMKYLHFTADPKQWLVMFMAWFNAIYLLRIMTLSLTILW